MTDLSNLDIGLPGTIEVDDGTGFFHMGNGTFKEATFRMDDGQILHVDSSALPMAYNGAVRGLVDIEIEVTWEETADILKWAKVIHGGTITTTTAGTTAVTDEELVMDGSYADGEWNALAYAADFDADCSVVVGSAVLGGGTTYVENTHYKLNRETGTIGRIAGAGITDGQTVYVDYVYDTYAGKYFQPSAEGATITQYAVRMIKPFGNGDNLRIQHTAVIFTGAMELPLQPGEKGNIVGVKSTIKFMGAATTATYGRLGRFEIYTP